MEQKEELIRAWIGQSKEKEMYPKVMNGGFNIGAFLVPDLYFLSRKLYVETYIYLFIMLLINIIIPLIIGVENYSKSVIFFIATVSRIITGFLFYPLYKRNIYRKIRKNEKKGLSYDEQLEIAQKRGGNQLTFATVAAFFIAIIEVWFLLIWSGVTLEMISETDESATTNTKQEQSIFDNINNQNDDTSNYSNETIAQYIKEDSTLNYDTEIWELQNKSKYGDVLKHKDSGNYLYYAGSTNIKNVDEDQLIDMIEDYEEELLESLQSQYKDIQLESLDYFKTESGLLVVEMEGKSSNINVKYFQVYNNDKQYVFMTSEKDIDYSFEYDAEDVIKTIQF